MDPDPDSTSLVLWDGCALLVDPDVEVVPVLEFVFEPVLLLVVEFVWEVVVLPGLLLEVWLPEGWTLEPELETTGVVWT